MTLSYVDYITLLLLPDVISSIRKQGSNINGREVANQKPLITKNSGNRIYSELKKKKRDDIKLS